MKTMLWFRLSFYLFLLMASLSRAIHFYHTSEWINYGGMCIFCFILGGLAVSNALEIRNYRS